MTEADRADAGAMLPRVYDELRSLAARILAGERADHTLQPTALVHEAWLRLQREKKQGWTDRTYFCAVAATVMRRILVNHARRVASERRGGGHRRLLVDSSLPDDRAETAIDLVELDDLLDRLSRLDERQARIVELRYFGGLTVDETASVLGVSARSVHRDWLMARAWIKKELAPGDRRDA